MADFDLHGLSEGATQQDEFDFRLPHLNLSATSKSASTTTEPLIEGLFGLLHFVEWGDFEQKMDTVLTSSASISAEFRGQAQAEFHKLRRVVNQTYKAKYSVIPNDGVSHPACFAHTPMNAGADPRKHYGTSSPVDVATYLFDGFRELMNGLHEPEYMFEYPERQFYLLGIPRLLKDRSPIPDRALCTVTMSRPDVLPLCTFEMKGPTEKFSCFVKSCCARLLQVSPRCSEERKERIVNEVCDGPRCPHELSARGMCLYLNEAFRTLPTGSESKPDMIEKIPMMVAQALVQALTCSGGCGFLFTYVAGISFELAKFSDSGKLIVLTSPLFCCGNQNGTAAAMLTLSDYAMKKLSKERFSSSSVASFARKILATSRSNSQAHRGLAGTSGTSGTLNQANEPCNASASDQGNTGSENVTSRARGIHASDMILHSFHFANSHATNDISAKRSPVTPSETPSAESDISDITEVTEGHCKGNAKNLLDLIYQDKGRMLHSGGSGTVFEVFWDGKRSALKLWSGETEEGLLELCKEVELYKFIKLNAPSLLGTAVPRAILTLNTANRDGLQDATVAVVTEFVGEGITRDSTGKLWTRDGDLSWSVGLDDEREICRAALGSLNWLHDNKILHGDIALRNLRVERHKNSGIWKVWWIDSGRAVFGEEFVQSRTFDEVYHCALLFESATELISSRGFSINKERRKKVTYAKMQRSSRLEFRCFFSVSEFNSVKMFNPKWQLAVVQNFLPTLWLL